MLRRRGPHDDSATRPAVVAVATLALFVVGAALVATSSGLGVSPDGVAYLSLADELRTEGSAYPVLAPSPTHYAPLWAIVVGGLSALSGVDDLLGIGRFLNALLAATIPVLVFVAVRRSPAAPAWWAAVAAVVVALVFGLFRLSVRALTEPLFVVLLLLTLLLVEAGVHRRSRRLLVVAALAAAALVATRFAGVVVLVPLAAAAWHCAPSRTRRVVDVLAVTAIALAPTVVWALAAPRTTTATHLDAGGRGGVDDLVQSIVEAGYVVVDPPSTGAADPLYLLLGAAVLASPFVAAAFVAHRPTRQGHTGGATSWLGMLNVSGLLPWLSFLVAYTVLIAVQRWWIDREIIDRYWVPYVVVAVVVVARAVAVTGVLQRRRARRVAVGVAAVIALVNLALVVSFAATRAGRGIELNEARYQDDEVFQVLADADPDVVLTDSARLVELHLVVLGDTEVEVRDIGCRWSGESMAVPMAEAATRPAAVLLAGACDRDETTAELAAIPGGEVVAGSDVGTVVVLRDP